MRANISTIQKLSSHNGSVDCTIISFKGCPLRCPWCRKPDSQAQPTELLWDRKKCFYGHLCSIHCPTKSLTFEKDSFHYNPATCINCRNCIAQCPSKALEFAGRIMDIQEISGEILTEKKVVLSGGEVLSQGDFAAELLQICRKAHIYTVVETSGYASSMVFSKVARHTDSFIFNIKHYDSRKHVQYTGVSQGRILENMDSAISMKIPITVQIPVIPGINSSLVDAAKFAVLLKTHHITTVELEPYQRLDKDTYKALSIETPEKKEQLPGTFPEQEYLREYLQPFLDEGLKASIN